MSHTLLLADDSVTIQRVIELTFADEDIRVIAVGDGQQAIDRIRADPPDIVLADTSMPEHDGYDVATFIKRDPALAHIPVVLLTGAFEPVDEDRAREVGSDAVLVKPFEPQVVINRVLELLGRPPAVASATSRPALDGSSRHAEADVPTPTPPPETGPPADDPVETHELPSQLRSVGAEPAPPPARSAGAGVTDDPLADYLDRMDEAFDRFEVGSDAPQASPAVPEQPPATPTGPSAPEEDFDSLEGALSVLEGALDKLGIEGLGVQTEDTAAADGLVGPDASPSTVDEAVPPERRSDEEPLPTVASRLVDDTPTVPAPPPTSLTSVPPALDPVEAPPPAASFESIDEPTPWIEVPSPVDTPVPPPEAVAPAPLPETAVVSTPEPAPPAPPLSPEAPDSPVEPVPSAVRGAPPSLADAFASLLAAEQGGVERAQTVYPWPRPASSPDINEELIARVADRVMTRLSGGMTGELVAQVVARVAEKLVREELERIKQS